MVCESGLRGRRSGRFRARRAVVRDAFTVAPRVVKVFTIKRKAPLRTCLALTSEQRFGKGEEPFQPYLRIFDSEFLERIGTGFIEMFEMRSRTKRGPQFGSLVLQIGARVRVDDGDGAEGYRVESLGEHAVQIPPVRPETNDQQILARQEQSHPVPATLDRLRDFPFGKLSRCPQRLFP